MKSVYSCYSWPWTIAGALLLGLVVACGAGSSAAPSVETVALPPSFSTAKVPTAPSFFIPGERMSFEISLRGVLGGTVVLGVGEQGGMDGRSVVVVQSLVQSAGVLAVVKVVRDRISSWIDLERGVVLKQEAQSKYGKKDATIETTLGGGIPGDFIIDYTPRGGKLQRATQKLPKEVFAFDSHAILGILRAWHSSDGDEKPIFLLSGRRLWRSTLRAGAHETVSTSLGGMRPAIRIDGVAQRVNRSLADVKSKKPRHFSIWISDDASRLPLLVLATTEYGDLRVELVEYSRPDRHVSARLP